MRLAARLAAAAGLLIAISGSASARPEFLELFMRVYHPAAGTPLAAARCQTCHTTAGPPALNPYGAEVRGVLNHAGRLTAAGLRSIQDDDANSNGEVNGVEIAAGRLPGNPALSAEAPSAVPPAPAGQSQQPAAPVPVHTLHPLLAHFPIALLFVGGVLEIIGVRARRADLRAAGFLDFAIGTVLAIVTAASGADWAVRAGFPLHGALLLHVSCAIAATVCAIGASLIHRSATRAGREADSAAYWGLIGATLVFVIVTAQLGTVMVRGW